MARNNAAIGSHARNALTELQLEAQTIGQRAQEGVHDLGEAARERCNLMQHRVEEQVVQNPVKSILIAAGVGMVLGFLWRR